MVLCPRQDWEHRKGRSSLPPRKPTSAQLSPNWGLCPEYVPTGHSAELRIMGTPEPVSLLTNTLSSSPLLGPTKSK